MVTLRVSQAVKRRGYVFQSSTRPSFRIEFQNSAAAVIKPRNREYGFNAATARSSRHSDVAKYLLVDKLQLLKTARVFHGWQETKDITNMFLHRLAPSHPDRQTDTYQQ